jgi:Domain of unknown function (DUF4105)
VKKSVAALWAVFCLCFALCARAGVIDAPAGDLEVSLMTYGPGAIYWERFGHDAIRLRDPTSGESADFNYGVFDFEDRAFLWNFARGYMRYMIDIQPSDDVQQDYIDEGRSVVEQRLALSAAQAESLRAFLIWNLRPENVGYNYDYLTNNCATRVRDALNSVLGGVLQAAFTTRPASMTYRGQIDRLMSAQAWLMVGMDLGLGPFADQPLNGWQESFLPMVLAREIRSVRIPDGHGGVKPLVVSERQLAPNRLKPPAIEPPDLSLPLGVAGIAIAVTMLVSRRRLPILQASVSVAYLIFAGIAGTLLLALWTLTMHHAAWRNANLLVFNPLAFALIGSAWRSRNRVGGSGFSRTLVAIQVGAALLAVVLHFLGATSQQNLPWLLFSVPVWIAVGVGIWT